MYGWLVVRHRNNHRELLGFLLDAYKPEYFYWEIVDNLRRLSLTGLLSFFSERSRVLAAALFSFVFLLLQKEAQPFAIDHDNATISRIR